MHFYNNTVNYIAFIPANAEYTALMQRLAQSPPPSPLSRQDKLQRSFNKKVGRPATPDIKIISAMLVSLRNATYMAITTPLDRVPLSHPRIQGLTEEDLWDTLEYAHLRPWVVADLSRPNVILPLPFAGAYPSRRIPKPASRVLCCFRGTW